MFCDKCGMEYLGDSILCDSCRPAVHFTHPKPDPLAGYMPRPELQAAVERAREVLMVERDLAAWRRLQGSVAAYDRAVVSIKHTLSEGATPWTNEVDNVKIGAANVARDLKALEAIMNEQDKPMCDRCDDTGLVDCTDWVDYGSTRVAMVTSDYCECPRGCARYEQDEYEAGEAAIAKEEEARAEAEQDITMIERWNAARKDAA